MQTPRDDDDLLDEIISRAVEGDKKALDALLRQPWLYTLLERVADWAERRHRVVHDIHGRDVQDVVADAIRRKITTLKNPGHISWRARLQSWSYTVAKNHCLNVINRDKRVADAYRESVIHENTQRIKHGKRRVARYSPATEQSDKDDEFFNAAQQERLVELMQLRQERTLSAEEGQELESLIEAELDGARLRAEAEAVELRRREIVSGIISELTPDEKMIIHLWADGVSLSAIADKANAPVTTVARNLKKIRGRLVESLSRELKIQTSDEKSLSEGLKRLISASVYMSKPHEFRA